MASDIGLLDTISLLNKFPVLIRAIADDYEPIPGYIYGEITKICFDSDSTCDMLHAYFMERLVKDSCFVKLKVLKLLRHLVLNGSAVFRNVLRKHDKEIKTCTNYSGPPNPQYGLSVYQTVRNEAKEVLLILFDSQTIESDADDKESVRTPEKFMAGMGPSHQSSKYDGFGFSASLPEKTVAEKVVDGISELMGKLMHNANDDSETFRKFLEVDRGPYRAVCFDINTDSTSLDGSPERNIADDETSSTISSDSLEKHENSGADELPEIRFFEDLSRSPCLTNGLLTRRQLSELRDRYGLLRGCVVLGIIKEKCVTSNDEQLRMKMLQFIEDCCYFDVISAKDAAEILDKFDENSETDSPAILTKTKKLQYISSWKLRRT